MYEAWHHLGLAFSRVTIKLNLTQRYATQGTCVKFNATHANVWFAMCALRALSLARNLPQ